MNTSSNPSSKGPDRHPVLAHAFGLPPDTESKIIYAEIKRVMAQKNAVLSKLREEEKNTGK